MAITAGQGRDGGTEGRTGEGGRTSGVAKRVCSVIQKSGIDRDQKPGYMQV